MPRLIGSLVVLLALTLSGCASIVMRPAVDEPPPVWPSENSKPPSCDDAIAVRMKVSVMLPVVTSRLRTFDVGPPLFALTSATVMGWPPVVCSSSMEAWLGRLQ